MATTPLERWPLGRSDRWGTSGAWPGSSDAALMRGSRKPWATVGFSAALAVAGALVTLLQNVHFEGWTFGGSGGCLGAFLCVCLRGIFVVPSIRRRYDAASSACLEAAPADDQAAADRRALVRHDRHARRFRDDPAVLVVEDHIV